MTFGGDGGPGGLGGAGTAFGTDPVRRPRGGPTRRPRPARPRARRAMGAAPRRDAPAGGQPPAISALRRPTSSADISPVVVTAPSSIRHRRNGPVMSP